MSFSISIYQSLPTAYFATETPLLVAIENWTTTQLHPLHQADSCHILINCFQFFSGSSLIIRFNCFQLTFLWIQEATSPLSDQKLLQSDTEEHESSSAWKSSIRRFVITRLLPLSHLRHYAKWALTPQSLNVKLGPRRNYHERRAAIRHYANQTARPLWPLRHGPNFTLRDRGVNARLA